MPFPSATYLKKYDKSSQLYDLIDPIPPLQFAIRVRYDVNDFELSIVLSLSRAILAENFASCCLATQAEQHVLLRLLLCS